MPFRTDTVMVGDPIPPQWFNDYVRDPLKYLKGRDYDNVGGIVIENSMRILPIRAVYACFFQLPDVTTAERTAMFDSSTDNVGAKVVYDSDLGAIMYYCEGAWVTVVRAVSVSQILTYKTNYTDGFRRLAPQGANSDLEWVYNRIQDFTWMTPTNGTANLIQWSMPEWVQYGHILVMGAGGGGGAGGVPPDATTPQAFKGHGGGGGTRGYYRQGSTSYNWFNWHKHFFIEIGAGGAAGVGDTGSGAAGSRGGQSALYGITKQNYLTDDGPRTRGSTILSATGGVGGAGGGGSASGRKTFWFSKGGEGAGHSTQVTPASVLSGYAAGGGGGGGYYKDKDPGDFDFNPHRNYAKPGAPGGSAVHRYDYNWAANTGGGAAGYDGTDGGDGADGILTLDSFWFGSGGGGGGGGGGTAAGDFTVGATSNGGDGGDGIQGSGGGGGGGCHFTGTAGSGGAGGNGVIRIVAW